jgi:hypothetical protein
MASLPSGAISPQIAQAPNMLRCAMSGRELYFFSIVFSFSAAKLENNNDVALQNGKDFIYLQAK